MVTPNDVLPPSLDEIKSRLAPFCRSHGVARMEVFGSLARGESRPGSDIDFLVIFQPGVHLGWDFFEPPQGNRRCPRVRGRSADAAFGRTRRECDPSPVDPRIRP
jgi:predicted nucleotidyltransferase